MSSRIAITDLQQSKHSQLHMSASDPPMFITIERHKYDYSIGTTVYELQIGVQKDDDEVLVHKLITRYSVIDQFNKNLRLILNNDVKYCLHQLPSFPPKKYLWNNDPVFVNEREKGLKNYFEGITKIPGIMQIPIVQDFFALAEVNSAEP